MSRGIPSPPAFDRGPATDDRGTGLGHGFLITRTAKPENVCQHPRADKTLMLSPPSNSYFHVYTDVVNYS